MAPALRRGWEQLRLPQHPPLRPLRCTGSLVGKDARSSTGPISVRCHRNSCRPPCGTATGWAAECNTAEGWGRARLDSLTWVAAETRRRSTPGEMRRCTSPGGKRQTSSCLWERDVLRDLHVYNLLLKFEVLTSAGICQMGTLAVAARELCCLAIFCWLAVCLTICVRCRCRQDVVACTNRSHLKQPCGFGM